MNGGYSVGDWIRLKRGTMGVAEARLPEYGDGQPWEAKAGSMGEISDVERITGWLTVRVDLDDAGQREPYRVRAIVTPDDVDPATRPHLPFADQWPMEPPEGLFDPPE
jgi:hypothetical protein